VVGGALLLAACGSDDDASDTTVTEIQPTTTTASATASLPIPATSPPAVAASQPATAAASATATGSVATTGPATEPSAAGTPTGTDTGSGAVPIYGYEVVNTFPHDPDAFTQGLVYVDGVLYEGTGLNGRSSLRRVDLATGEVLQQVDLPEEQFGEGIAVLGERIWQLTWQSRIGWVYDRATFKSVGTVEYVTEGWGLTTDGERLIMSDGSSTLYFRDPETFGEIGRVEVRDGDSPVTRLNELEYVDGEVWANVWQTDRIARIDPASGRVTGWVDLTGLLSPEDRAGHQVDVLNGIAWDADTGRLFVTGKLWPVLYEIRIRE
jgi:glutamine cyclotransferase